MTDPFRGPEWEKTKARIAASRRRIVELNRQLKAFELETAAANAKSDKAALVMIASILLFFTSVSLFMTGFAKANDGSVLWALVSVVMLPAMLFGSYSFFKGFDLNREANREFKSALATMDYHIETARVFLAEQREESE